MSRPLGLIGVPTSAGAFAPGQEQAPGALRDAGLPGRLHAGGVHVNDRGDLQPCRWRPDRAHPHAQNLATVVEIVQETARRVAEATDAGEATLVLGGDCTVGIGTVAGHTARDERLGLLYLDAHADCNVPASVREGALDWMGLAHMLGEEGAVRALVEAGPRAPLLAPEQVVLVGWDAGQATAFERGVLERRGIGIVAAGEIAADPEGAARRALALVEDRCERLLVHFDVDLIDFTDVPLSENWGRNEGVAYTHALRALGALLGDPRVAGLTITELNPDHVEAGAGTLERFAADVGDALAAAPGIRGGAGTGR